MIFNYKVVKGDTLAVIAKHFGTTAQKIATANGIADPNKLRIGQVLYVEATRPATATIDAATGKVVDEDIPEIVVTGQRVPQSDNPLMQAMAKNPGVAALAGVATALALLWALSDDDV